MMSQLLLWKKSQFNPFEYMCDLPNKIYLKNENSVVTHNIQKYDRWSKVARLQARI